MEVEEVTHRDRGGWTATALAYVDRVNQVLQELRDYWPLTLRQVYYQLVAALFIENSQAQYKKLSRILSKAGLDERVSWDAIEDRARSLLNSAGWEDRQMFVAESLEQFLSGYRRDLLQSQESALEIWVEKDALSRVCHRVAFEYCVPVIVARGFSSVSFVHECRKRVELNAQWNKPTTILYFGDLDPSGWEMLPCMLETLQEEMHLGELVVGARCALTVDQVSTYNLPQDPDALKPTDPRTKKYMRQFGPLAVELDALPPPALEALVRQSIEAHLDLSQFRAEQAQEREEARTLSHLRSQVNDFVRDLLQ